MIDINALFSQALTAAVAEAIKPLAARVDELETRVTDVTAQLARALLAAETGHAAASQAGLDDELLKVKARLDELEATDARDLTKDQVREIAEAAAEEALDEHTSSYDHDDYDNVYNEWGGEEASDFVKDRDIQDQIEEAVKEVLNNATFSVSI